MIHDPAAAAAAHAEAIAHATAELLRFSREGPSTPRYPFGLDDISAILAEALMFSLGSEVSAIAASPDGFYGSDHEEHEHGSQLCAALRKWLAYANGGGPEE